MIHAVLAFIAFLGIVSCQSQQRSRVLDSEQSQVQLRQIQSRAFDTPDANTTLRTVIATLQDLGFVIDKADGDLGSVTATKLNQYQLKMTVSVRARGESQLVVRASAQYNITPIIDPQPYQQFFASLEKAMFLQAQAVE